MCNTTYYLWLYIAEILRIILGTNRNFSVKTQVQVPQVYGFVSVVSIPKRVKNKRYYIEKNVLCRFTFTIQPFVIYKHQRFTFSRIPFVSLAAFSTGRLTESLRWNLSRRRRLNETSYKWGKFVNRISHKSRKNSARHGSERKWGITLYPL